MIITFLYQNNTNDIMQEIDLYKENRCIKKYINVSRILEAEIN